MKTAEGGRERNDQREVAEVWVDCTVMLTGAPGSGWPSGASSRRLTVVDPMDDALTLSLVFVRL